MDLTWGGENNTWKSQHVAISSIQMVPLISSLPCFPPFESQNYPTVVSSYYSLLAANCNPWCSPTAVPTRCWRRDPSTSAWTSAASRQRWRWTAWSRTRAEQQPHQPPCRAEDGPRRSSLQHQLHQPGQHRPGYQLLQEYRGSPCPPAQCSQQISPLTSAQRTGGSDVAAANLLTGWPRGSTLTAHTSPPPHGVPGRSTSMPTTRTVKPASAHNLPVLYI